MTAHLPSLTAPLPVAHEANSNNGQLPSAILAKRIADGVNHLATYQKKVLMCRSQHWGAVGLGGAPVVTPWPNYFRTGENTSGVRFYLGILDAYAAGTPTDPYVTVEIKTAAGAVASTKDVHYNGRNTPAAYYNNTSCMAFKTIDLTGLSANTEYYWTISVVDKARLVYLTALEIPALPHADDTKDGVIDAGKMVGGHPLHDATIADVQAALKLHWRHSGQHLLVWNPDYDTTFTTTQTTYTNLVDPTSITTGAGGSTAVSAASPGYVLPLLYHGTTSRSNAIPVKLAVKATRTAGAGTLSVRVTDGTNDIENTSITTGGTGDWYTTTGTLPGATSKFDVWAAVTSGTFQIDAVSLFEYEA